MKTDNEGPPFYIGETVIAVDAIKGSVIKNGLIYRVYSCNFLINPANGLGPFWYVGVEREGFKSHDSLRPSIFRSIDKPVLMVFEKLTEQIPIIAN